MGSSLHVRIKITVKIVDKTGSSAPRRTELVPSTGNTMARFFRKLKTFFKNSIIVTRKYYLFKLLTMLDKKKLNVQKIKYFIRKCFCLQVSFINAKIKESALLLECLFYSSDSIFDFYIFLIETKNLLPLPAFFFESRSDSSVKGYLFADRTEN